MKITMTHPDGREVETSTRFETRWERQGFKRKQEKAKKKRFTPAPTTVSEDGKKAEE